jgi:2'-5' RNA ligase
MIRLFIGIELDKQIKEPLSKIQEQVRFIKPSWVPPKNIHLTVKFLGWSNEESIGEIISAIRSVTEKYKHFEITIDGLGAFPNTKKARIFWVGLEGNTVYLSRLQGDLEDVLLPLGYEKEKRPYHPHITLARLRVFEDVRKALSLKMSYRQMKVKELTLFQSRLTPKGAVYSVVEKFSLKA